MKLLVLVYTTLIILIMMLLRDLEPTIAAPVNKPVPTVRQLSADRLTEVVNEWRVREGYQPYAKANRLCEFAAIRAEEIQAEWSHSGFYYDRVCTQEEQCYLAENLAKGQSTEEQVLDDWLHSASHAANLKASYTYACIVCDNNHCAHEFGNL